MLQRPLEPFRTFLCTANDFTDSLLIRFNHYLPQPLDLLEQYLTLQQSDFEVSSKGDLQLLFRLLDGITLIFLAFRDFRDLLRQIESVNVFEDVRETLRLGSREKTLRLHLRENRKRWLPFELHRYVLHPYKRVALLLGQRLENSGA